MTPSLSIVIPVYNFAKFIPETLDSIVSVAFLAIVALFYRWYGKRWREPDELVKIIVGSVFVIGGMFCLFMAAATQAPGAKIAFNSNPADTADAVRRWVSP